MFGDTIYLGKIPEADWVSNICICSRFNKAGITISEGHAEDICRRVECYSSYVQQLCSFKQILSVKRWGFTDKYFKINNLSVRSRGFTDKLKVDYYRTKSRMLQRLIPHRNFR